eukprot:5382754-Amphidinium_carterae.1
MRRHRACSSWDASASQAVCRLCNLLMILNMRNGESHPILHIFESHPVQDCQSHYDAPELAMMAKAAVLPQPPRIRSISGCPKFMGLCSSPSSQSYPQGRAFAPSNTSQTSVANHTLAHLLTTS